MFSGSSVSSFSHISNPLFVPLIIRLIVLEWLLKAFDRQHMVFTTIILY